MRLRITIDGKAYEVEVEILEDADAAPEYPPYPPAPSAFVAPPILDEHAAVEQSIDADSDVEGCRSPVTGMVIQVLVEPGQAVEPGQVVMVLESMKMEMQITASGSSVVKKVLVTPGNSVKVNQLLVEFE